MFKKNKKTFQLYYNIQTWKLRKEIYVSASVTCSYK